MNIFAGFKASCTKRRVAPKSKYRFAVGDRVVCNTGEWKAGTVVALDYHEEGCMRPGQTVPYQVELDDGVLIFVPVDLDMCCKRLVPPWWAGVFNQSDSFYAQNPSSGLLFEAAAGRDVDARDHADRTALMEAVRLTWPNGINELISMKADVNIAGSDQSCALHIAAQCGKVSAVKLLVDAKADLNCQDTDPEYDPEFTSTSFGDRLDHRSPLHYVCLAGDALSARVLLQARADANIQDAQWQTPLHLAIGADQGDCIDLLLSSGADTSLGNIISGMSNTPLMDAAAAGKTELVAKLIEARADIHLQGKQDMSALHLAARSRRAPAAEVLIGARADMNQESKCGTALQLARKNGGADLLKVFGVQLEKPSKMISGLDKAQRAALFLGSDSESTDAESE